jgi:hypothetical protein
MGKEAIRTWLAILNKGANLEIISSKLQFITTKRSDFDIEVPI